MGLMGKEKWGYDYTYDCTGNVNVMRTALEVAHRGWGESCVIGVAAAGKEISTRPFQLVTGRNWKGTAFGGWKSRTEVPKLVQTVMRGEMALEPFITHTFKGLDQVNASIDALHSGECLRAIVNIGESDIVQTKLPKLKSNVKMEGGFMKQLSHWSEADQHGLAVVFPDTSARPEVAIEGQDDSYDFGSGAGFYVDATTEKWKKHYNMYTYITKELPELVSGLFPVDPEKRSITGHSMGGHGALVCHLKNPGMFSSVSAFSPICNPTVVPWGEKAFTGYLGSVEAGKAYDATELVSNYDGPKVPVLIDQGTADGFLENQLKPKNFFMAAAKNGYNVELRMQPLYDHSYYFISTFMRDHIDFHARALGLRPKL